MVCSEAIYKIYVMPKYIKEERKLKKLNASIKPQACGSVETIKEWEATQEGDK